MMVREKIDKIQVEWILVVIEIALAAWTYYVYVYLICIQTAQNRVESTILLLTFHHLFFMTLWCYLKTLLTPRIPVPQEFHMDVKEWDKLEVDSILYRQTREFLGVKTYSSHRGTVKTLNYCYQCGHIKPDRCHHCSRCKACVLRMDHHCPWLNRCIGFHNHKFFILFIHYSFVFFVFFVITSSGFLHRIWRRDWVGKRTDSAGINGTSLQNKGLLIPNEFLHKEKETVKIATAALSTAKEAPLSAAAVAVSASTSSSLVAISTTPAAGAAAAAATGTKTSLIAGTGLSAAFLQVFILIVLYILAIVSITPLLEMHAELMAKNVTTLEQFKPAGALGRALSETTFDLGSVSANHKEIMGPRLWLWPFPVFTSQGDGIHFNIGEDEA